MPAAMTLAEAPRGADCYLIEIGGEVDVSVVDRLRNAINRGGEHPLVLLDLSRCEFIDSSAIATIILGNLELEKEGRHLALLSPGTEVMRILTIAGLADRDLVFPDERAARAKLLGGGRS
jgi:anti-anti-sigma factor